MEKNTVLFVKRERLRRRLINTKPNETICLNHDETEMITSWLKELERKAKSNGIQSIEKGGC